MASRQRYKILILSKHLNLGGAERLLADALPYLDRERFEYHFAYLLPGSDFLVPQFEAAGFPVHCLGMRSSYHFPLILLALHRLQRRHGFDLMHAHLPLPGIAARIVGRQHTTPVAYTEHNLPERYHSLTYLASRLTYGWNARVFAVSGGVSDSLTRLGWAHKTEVATLLNGVPVEQVRAEARDLDGLRRELAIPEGHLVVGTVAVFSRQKRLHDWLAVARRVADRREDVTFVLAGSGPEEAALKARAKALGLTDRVRLPGFRPDGRRVLGLLDVYLMSSEFEGLPIALLEAMALAKPVVATAVGGVPEAVQDGAEGFLAPAGAVDDLTLHLIHLLDDPALRLEMGRRGARRIEEKFHIKARVQLVENAYMEILGRAKA